MSAAHFDRHLWQEELEQTLHSRSCLFVYSGAVVQNEGCAALEVAAAAAVDFSAAYAAVAYAAVDD